MDLAVVFHPPPPGGHIQAGKLVSLSKDAPSGGGGRACSSLHEKVCAIAPDRPPGAAYYAQTTGDSTEALGGTVHFRELIAIFFHRQGRHHHTRAGPARLHRMLAHGGETMVTFGGTTALAPYTKKKGVSLMA
jgi:hypothetical protein